MEREKADSDRMQEYSPGTFTGKPEPRCNRTLYTQKKERGSRPACLYQHIEKVVVKMLKLAPDARFKPLQHLAV